MQVLAARRRQLLSEKVIRSEFVTIADCARHFGVSASTIARDLDVLSTDGRLSRVRGGAISAGAARRMRSDRPTSYVA
ncbi:hypothetical protein BH10ACT8_BH10ACT8_13220 [soil metagenome]|jgi:DeoR/GlpR family transcriptional regulator of sugar metabolism